MLSSSIPCLPFQKTRAVMTATQGPQASRTCSRLYAHAWYCLPAESMHRGDEQKGDILRDQASVSASPHPGGRRPMPHGVLLQGRDAAEVLGHPTTTLGQPLNRVDRRLCGPGVSSFVWLLLGCGAGMSQRLTTERAEQHPRGRIERR